MNMKILAVVAAAIIIVAGIGAFLLLQNNDTEKFVGNSDGRLQVYGNANNDDYLNADDVTLIKNIVSKNSDSDSSNDIDWKKLYPYADANNDGKVDSADATVAQNLADRKEGTTVYYLDGNSDVKSIEYPVKSICVLGTATFTAAQSLGLSDIVYGRSGTSQTNDVIYKDIWSKPAVSSTMVDFDISLFSNVADKVSGGIDAIIQNNGGMGAPIDSDTEAELSKLGTQTITMKFDVKGEENYYLTLGFLCGADDKAKKVVGLMDSVYETVDKAVKDAGEKPTVLCCWVTGSMGTGFYASSAASVSAFIPAAGGDLIEIPDGSMDITSGTVGILDDKYNGDFILAPVRTSVSYLDDKEDWKSVWESTTGSTSTLSLMDACPDRTFLFMYGMPFICKVAYAVECMYGSYVSSGYGDDINQKWVEICYIQNLGSDYKVSEHGFCIGKKDFGGESGESGVATSISMYVDTAEIKIGESKLLSYVTAPAGSKATGTTVWKSSDTSVATIDAGTVTGVAAGTATITLTIGSLSTQCTVTVIDDSVKDYTKTVCDADADKIASSFVSKYNGVFGTYTLDPGATSKHASVSAVSGSRTFTIVFDGNIEAASMYEDAVNSGAIEAPLGMPGETISEYSYTGTFDGFCGYKHEATAMATFTALKFAAYDGNVFVNGYDTWQYRPSALATDDELKEFVDAVASSVSDPSESGAVTPVMGADEIAAAFVSAYGASSFGTYSVDAGSSDSSATAVATIGTRTPSIVFRVNSAAETLYNNAVSSGEIEALLGMPGETATEFVYSGGFDGCYAYKHEAFAMAKFTALKFAVYYGNVYIDGYTVWQYHAGNLATDEEIKELLDALAKAVGTSGGSDKPSAPASIDLSETTISLVAGDSVGIEATVSDGSSVTWSSSDESIAIIADGSITGVAYGTAVITAAVGDVKAECTVNVLPETILNAGADKVAAAFVSSYGSGLFGTYFVESDSDGSSAMVSDGSHYFRILGSYDADDLFETLSASVDAKPDPYANGAKVALDLSMYGFDNSNACTYTVSMGGTMTWMYFAVTEGNMAVDGTLKIQSYRGASSDALFDGFFNALKSAMDHQTVVSADVDDVAAKFVSSYSSVSTFGTMSIAEGSNDMLAIALFETGSRVAPTTAVAFYGCTDASVRFEEAKATMDSMIADMGMPATEVTTTASFDGFYGKAVTMAMGPSAFTMLFFTVYESDVFVDGYSSYQLHRNAAATSEEIDAMMSALASALN
jgi:iron complex transport system substrate-binding protein